MHRSPLERLLLPGHGRLPVRVRIGLVVAGFLALGVALSGVLPYDTVPRDAHAYWAVDASDLYRRAELGEEDAYLYAPAFAQATTPLRALSFDTFRATWMTLGLAALAAIGGLPLLVFPGAIEDLVRGNVHLLMGAAVVAGLRWPGLWAFVLLTKVTAGIGLLWFAVRGEWSRLAVAAGVTAGIVIVSVLVGGADAWGAWLRVLAAGAQSDRIFDYLGVAPPPLAVRLPAAALLVAWGARTNRRWTVPLAVMLGVPVLWPSAFALIPAAVVLAGTSHDRPA